MRNLSTLLFWLLPLGLAAQNSTKVFQVELYKHVLKLHDDKNYLTFGHSYKVTNSPSPALLPNESGDIIVEGNLSPVMGIIKPDSIRKPFFQRMRLSVPVNINIRLIKGVSSPMLPPSNQVGLKFDYSLFSKCWIPNTSPLFYLTAEIRHYSNGQGIGSLVPDDNTGTRNDYASGDFSTNFQRYSATFSTFLDGHSRHLFVIRGFYQNDFDLNSTLNFLEAQNGRYGKHRVGGIATYELFSNILSKQLKALFPAKAKKKGYALSPIIEAEVINIMDEAVKDDKLSIRVKAIIGFEALNEFGFFYQYYRGRDYLNIRYDLAIEYHAIGLHFRPF